MHKNAMKCNETLSKWCKNKHGASKIMDTLETYQQASPSEVCLFPTGSINLSFLLREKLVAVLIIPSLGVPNGSVIYINTAPQSMRLDRRDLKKIPIQTQQIKTIHLTINI
jgi:hypothetical protein